MPDKKVEAKKESVRFYCENHKEMKTLIAGTKVRFINHEFSTADPIIIQGLDKLSSVVRYDEYIKKRNFALDKDTMSKLEASVRADLIKELEPKIRTELKEELKEEVRLELEAELRTEIEDELKAKGAKNAPKVK